MKEIIVDISINADQYLKNYRTPGAVVVTQCRQGRQVRFPANILREFVTHSGVSGTFRILFNFQGKFHRIELIND